MQDYDGFVKVVEQYEADADSINEVLGQFAAKTDEIRNTVEDMNNGINDISTAIDENAQDVTGVAQSRIFGRGYEQDPGRNRKQSGDFPAVE